MVKIMERFGWDYQTYLDQPRSLIDLIGHMMEIEAQKAKQQQRNL